MIHNSPPHRFLTLCCLLWLLSGGITFSKPAVTQIGNNPLSVAIGNAQQFTTSTQSQTNLGTVIVELFSRSDKGDEAAQKLLSDLRRAFYLVSSAENSLDLLDAFTFCASQGEEHFPNIPPSSDVGQTIGVRLFNAGKKEEAMKTLLREAYCLQGGAIIMLRILYLNQVDGYPRHDPRILQYFQQTADEGSPRSRLVMAELYLDGIGIKQDRDHAITLLKSNTMEEAQKLLAQIYYEDGKTNEMLKVFEQAARRDETWGHFAHAIALGEKQDHHGAFKHLRRTLELQPDHFQAMTVLAKAYVQGSGAAKDEKKGFALYKQAADEGSDPIAMCMVGIMYSKGIGTEKSEEQAISYLKQAAAQDVDDAKLLLQEIEKRRNRPSSPKP